MKRILIAITLAELALAQDPRYPCQSIDPGNCAQPQATETLHPIQKMQFTAIAITPDTGTITNDH